MCIRDRYGIDGEKEETQFGGIDFCPESNTVVAAGPDGTIDGVVENLSIVQCTSEAVKFMATTSKHTTYMMTLNDGIIWTIEDGLQTMDSVILLDAGGLAIAANALTEEDQALLQSELDPIKRIKL